MAYLINIVCQGCGREAEEVVGAGSVPPQICHFCRDKRGKQDRAAHLKGLRALTLQQRLRRIEEWIYDYKPQHVPAPRF